MEQIPEYKSAQNTDPGEENYPTACHFNHVAVCGPHFSFFSFFFWGGLMERGRTVFILSCLLGQPGVTHALFYAMNGEHDRVAVSYTHLRAHETA